MQEERRMLILDYSVINSSGTIFNIIQDYFQTADIYICYNLVLSSTNNRLKKYIVENGVRIDDDTIEISSPNSTYKIITKKSVLDKKCFTQYAEFIALGYQLKIITLSIDILLECKFMNINCELYTDSSYGKIGMYTDINKNPRINQFKYDDTTKNLERYTADTWKLVENYELYGFSPLSYKQKAYLDLLMDENISLVLCSGSAGTGKTFMACLTGIHKMLDKCKYNNIVMSRATIDIGDNSIGFLPGSKEDKMSHWVQPMKDNLEIILKKANISTAIVDDTKEKKIQLQSFNGFYRNKSFKSFNSVLSEEIIAESSKYEDILMMSKKERKKMQKKNRKIGRLSYMGNKQEENTIITTELLIKEGKVKIECISFFRGRTFIDTFCIIDEAQNLTMHEIKTVITRIGKGSKLVMIGDTEQSDLKNKNNDFYDVIKKMTGNEMVGVIQLDKSMRSGIASLAVKLL